MRKGEARLQLGEIAGMRGCDLLRRRCGEDGSLQDSHMRVDQVVLRRVAEEQFDRGARVWHHSGVCIKRLDVGSRRNCVEGVGEGAVVKECLINGFASVGAPA